MILSRKLIENLIIEVLVDKYPPNVPGNLELYYNQNENRHNDFSVLVDNLSQRKNDFMTENKTVDELVSKVHVFKDRANLATHTISIVPDEDDLLKYNVQHIFDLLSRLIR